MASDGKHYAQRAHDHAVAAGKAVEDFKYKAGREAGPALVSKAHVHAAFAHLNAMFAIGVVESLFHDEPRPDVSARVLSDAVQSEEDAKHWANSASLTALGAVPNKTAETCRQSAEESPSGISLKHKGKAIEASKSAVLAHLMVAERGSL